MLSKIRIDTSQVISDKATKKPRLSPSGWYIRLLSDRAWRKVATNAGASATQRGWEVSPSCLNTRNADRQYSTVVRTLAVVGNIVSSQWLRCEV